MPTLPLAPALQTILDAELATGNLVAEVSDWPPTCELFLLLRYRFRRAHPLVPDLSYRELNDPHYWQAEYAFDGGRQVLACGFAVGPQ